MVWFATRNANAILSGSVYINRLSPPSDSVAGQLYHKSAVRNTRHEGVPIDRKRAYDADPD